MKMRAILFSVLLSVCAYADTITLTAIDFGTYRQDGFHNPSDNSYLAGRVSGADYRSFFKFNLSGVTDTIVFAQLRLYTHQVTASSSYTLYQANPFWLGSSGISQYNDLGSGSQFGAATLNPTTSYRTVGFGLNGNAITSLNAASGQWALGGRYNTTAGAAFYNYSGGPSPQIVLETIPEPSTIAFVGLFGGGLLVVRRVFRI